MKTRVNSKTNNIKGKASNSFKTKKQGYNSCPIESAVGYCLFHQININTKVAKLKQCKNCPRFIIFNKKEEE